MLRLVEVTEPRISEAPSFIDIKLIKNINKEMLFLNSN